MSKKLQREKNRLINGIIQYCCDNDFSDFLVKSLSQISFNILFNILFNLFKL